MNQHVLRIAGREYTAEVRDLTPERAVVVVDGREYAVELVRLGRRKVTADAVRAVTGAGAPASPQAVAPAPLLVLSDMVCLLCRKDAAGWAPTEKHWPARPEEGGVRRDWSWCRRVRPLLR